MKSFLLDTHTLLWYFAGDEKLSKKALKEIQDGNTNCFVSMTSLWEIAIKQNLGKLKLDFSLDGMSKLLFDNDIEILQISFEHILGLSKLEKAHKDPFDRLIISQAIIENITVISKDKNFSEYKGLKVLW